MELAFISFFFFFFLSFRHPYRCILLAEGEGRLASLLVHNSTDLTVGCTCWHWLNTGRIRTGCRNRLTGRCRLTTNRKQKPRQEESWDFMAYIYTSTVALWIMYGGQERLLNASETSLQEMLRSVGISTLDLRHIRHGGQGRTWNLTGWRKIYSAFISASCMTHEDITVRHFIWRIEHPLQGPLRNSNSRVLNSTSYK
jgi:hypothetical protein